MSRYQDIRASSCCKVHTPFCNSKSVVNKQNDDNPCFLWCILGLLHEVDIRRESITLQKILSLT